LLLAIGLAFAFQYGVAPFLVDKSEYTGFVTEKWLDGCTQYEDEVDLREACAGNNGVFRVTGATTLFFCLAAIAVACKPTANREAWPAKYILYLFLVGVTVVIPNEPLFSDIYLNIARIGGICFIFLQQVIILDIAYDWNENWVERSNAAEAEEQGSGKKWLVAILASCVVIYGLAIAGITLLFVYFLGCPSNNGFISFTLAMIVLITGAQLSGDEGSLLTSACISLWAVFLCYTAVAKNPDVDCNPKLGEPDTAGIVLGVIVTVISMGWTGFSWTAEDKLIVRSSETQVSQPEETTSPKTESKVTGIVTGEDYGEMGDEEEAKAADADEHEESPENNPRMLSNSWRLNLMLAVIACWMAMALTNWGSISSGGNAANPQVGRIGMWMVIASQWLVLALYLWTLVAPRILTNRDFS